MAPEVTEEVDLAQDIYKNIDKTKIKNISESIFFNEISYIDFYRQMLNKHNGKSFFNMTGFGDISILFSIHTLLKDMDDKNQNCLFDHNEYITVFTSDIGLTNRINYEFSGLDVKCIELKVE